MNNKIKNKKVTPLTKLGNNIKHVASVRPQLNQIIRFQVSKVQKQIIDEAFELYINMFSENFGYLNSLMVRHYQEKMDMSQCVFCQKLCKILERVYFYNIKWEDKNKCKYYNKIFNLNEDIKFSKTNFECTVSDGLLISQTVLDFYTRILLGQLHHIDEQMRLFLYWDQIKDTYNSDVIKTIISDLKYYYFGFSLNASYGICSTEFCAKGKKSYQMQRWIENDIYGYFKVKGPGNDYANQAPLVVTKQKRIKVTVLGISIGNSIKKQETEYCEEDK